MKFVTKREFEALEKSGLIKTDKMNKNFTVTSKQKKSPRGKHYVEETDTILKFLNNLQ